MNGLYGKTLQKPRWEKTFFVNESSDWNEIFPKYYIREIDNTNFDGTWIIKGVAKDPILLEKAITKPTQLGCFVLAYSRRIMLKFIRNMDNFYYTDTDSLFVHNDDWEKSGIQKGKGLGFLKDELGENCKIIKAMFVSPKLYYVKYLCKKGEEIYVCEKVTGKGVKCDRSGVIPLFEKDFENMLRGETISVENKSVFKRFAWSLNNSERQKGTETFSVSIRDEKKNINKVKYRGREFDTEGNSVPVGYSNE
jgi:hypothetical protein